jgi:hypothetical protein
MFNLKKDFPGIMLNYTILTTIHSKREGCMNVTRQSYLFKTIEGTTGEFIILVSEDDNG